VLADLAAHVRIQYNLAPGGRVEIIIEVKGRRRGTDDLYYYSGVLAARELALDGINANPQP
jgi:hypothetical protein